MKLLRRHHWLWGVFALIVIAPAAAVLVVTVVLPVKRSSGGPRANMEAGTVPAASDDGSGALGTTGARESDALRRLALQKAEWEARLELAKGDSIGFFVDLGDSIAGLEVKGVRLRTCKIHEFDLSAAVRAGLGDSLESWIGKPFVLQGGWATLPKEPIRVRQAPKDTTEAKSSAEPFLPESNDVFYTLRFDRSLSVEIRQLERPSFRGRMRHWAHGLGIAFDSAGDAVRSLVRGELPRHQVKIEITLSRNDAKAIYRAIPKNAQMALRVSAASG